MDGYVGGGLSAASGPPPALPSSAEDTEEQGPPANDYRPRSTIDQQVIAGKRLPELHPHPDPGSMEAIADELAQWVAVTGDAVAARIIGSDAAPFAAKASEAQQQEFYAMTLFAEDGTPNPPAWSSLFQRTGAYGLVEAVRGAERWRNANGLPVVLPPAQGQLGAEHTLATRSRSMGQTDGPGSAVPPASGPGPSVVPPPQGRAAPGPPGGGPLAASSMPLPPGGV
jgi:hypothetical protein